MPRTPSASAHERVLEAAQDLFAERGFDATSMDAIASASGVSKATIYKHWSDKDALCLEVLSRVHGLDAEPPAETGDLRADLVAVLSRKPPERYAEVQSRMMPHLLAYAARHPAFGLTWRTRVMDPPRERLARLLARGVAERRLPADLDVEASIALLLGPLIYCHIVRLMHRETPPDMSERVVDAFWRAHATEPRRRGR